MNKLGIAVLLASTIATGSVSASTFQLSQADTAFTAGETNIASTKCPSGTYATGGGWSIVSGTVVEKTDFVAAINNNGTWFKGSAYYPSFVLSLNQPTSGDGSGWSVGGVANTNLTLRVYAICATQN